MQPIKKIPPALRWFNRVLLILIAVLVVVQCARCSSEDAESSSEKNIKETQSLVAEALADFAVDLAATPSASQTDSAKSQPAKPDLSHVYAQKDTGLARLMDTFLRRYHPDYAIYLAVDAHTNEIIAWGERKDGAIQSTPDYLSRASFPAASLAKTVTIAAAFESKRYSIHTEIPLIGKAHTLYKRQLKIPENYRGPITPLHLAFAKSYNAPMALVGMNVGAKHLRSAAEKLGFNRNFSQGIPERSNYSPPDSGYGLAEVASGFTKSTTLSPLQAAGIVRAILMKKSFEIPWEKSGAKGFAPTQPIALGIERFSDNTYFGLRQAMVATATEGTARKNISTRNISRKFFADLEIGGKTGSLDGTDPQGRYDWFMGFAQSRKNPEKSVVLVVLQVHGERRTQASTLIASLLINYWAKEK